MTNAKNSPIHRKLARSVFTSALAFMVLISSAFYFSELERAEAKSRLMLNQLLDTVENTASVAAFSGSVEIGQDVLQGLLRNDLIHSVHLSNQAGLDLSAEKASENRHPIEVTRELKSPFGKGDIIGYLKIADENKITLQETRHNALLYALNSATLIGFIVFLLLALVRASLSKPLLNVSNALHSITQGQQQRLEILPKHLNDELGRLVQDINTLLDKLEEQFKAEHKLREENQDMAQQLREIFETTSAGIFRVDEKGNLLTANQTLTQVLGLNALSPQALMGVNLIDLAFAEPQKVYGLMCRETQSGHTGVEDFKLKNFGNKGDDVGWVHCLLSRRSDSQGCIYFEGVVYDVTERRKAERRIRHEADHDPLTGLLRRNAAEQELSRALQTPTDAGKTHILLLLDLDSFKQVNDTHGHAAGDRVLVECAKRFAACVRNGDIVARLGGDEFLIGLKNISLARAYQIAGNIVAEARQPIQINAGVSVRVGVSIGMAMQSRPGISLTEILEKADKSMYEIKRKGKDGFAMITNDEMNPAGLEPG
jgi:diguanylate cyclase (GGDEF)-like protein/PAS domain S-box-containing protein